MVDIANAAYFGTNGKLEIGADNFTAGVTSCALVPATPKAKVTDIGGGVQSFVGAPAWDLVVTFSQDWVTTGSLSKQSIAWHGQTKEVTYTPEDGGDALTISVVWEAAQVGGAANAHHQATLTLGAVGQPEFAPSV